MTAAIDSPLQDFDYGMRECSVRDPDCNRLSFGPPLGGNT